MFSGSRRSISLSCLIPLVIASCTAPGDPTSLRVRSARTLARHLERNYTEFELGVRVAMDECESEVRAAKTTRQYLLALARFMSALNDPHVYFVDLEAYFLARGTPVYPACKLLRGHGGHYWIVLRPEHIVSGDVEVSDPEGQLFELVSVDGVAPPLSRQLLLLPHEEHANVALLDASGREQRVVVRGVPVEPNSARASRAERIDMNEMKLRLENDPDIRALGDLSVDVRYMSIGDFARETIDAFEKGFDQVLDGDALVIDLRENVGGRLNIVQRMLSHFVTRPTPYGALEIRQVITLIDGEVPIWREPLLRVVPQDPVYRNPLVVLTDTDTVSGGELLAAALQDVRGALVVGHRTAGGGGIVAKVTLPDGLTVAYTGARLRRLDGRGIQHVGVRPDTLVEVDYDEILSRGEPALAESRDWVLLMGFKEAVRRGRLMQHGDTKSREGSRDSSQ